MAICPKCGLNGEGNFCTACGEQLKAAVAIMHPEEEWLAVFVAIFDNVSPILKEFRKKNDSISYHDKLTLDIALNRVRNLPKPRSKELMSLKKGFEEILVKFIQIYDADKLLMNYSKGVDEKWVRSLKLVEEWKFAVIYAYRELDIFVAQLRR